MTWNTTLNDLIVAIENGEWANVHEHAWSLRRWLVGRGEPPAMDKDTWARLLDALIMQHG